MDVLKDLTDFFFKKKEINLDNFTFKLFYRGAAGLCILASVFSAGGSYFGDPIGRVFFMELTYALCLVPLKVS